MFLSGEKMKKLLLFLSFLLGAVLLVQAQSGFYKLQYLLEGAEACVSKCPQQMSGKVEVPEKTRLGGQEYPVTGVGCLLYHPFKDCRGVTEVVLPSSVTKIESESFRGCVRLKKINLPSSVKKIGFSAFEGCESLDAIVVPQGISMIELSTFKNCKTLKSVSLPFTVKEIGNGSFSGCVNLTDFKIPSYVVDIDDEAFKDCSSWFDVILPSVVKKIGAESFSGCSSIKEIAIPGSVDYVWNGAFSKCSGLKKVDLKGCSFGGGESMFELCENLESVDNFNLKSVPAKMFKNCGKLKSISWGPAVSFVNPNAFVGTSIEELVVPKTVVEGIEYAENYVGWKCLKKISVDPANNKYTSVEGVLYNKDKTKLLRFPPGKESDEFVLPASVKQIADYAFSGCKGLKKLVLPKGFSAFSENSFSDCPDLNVEMK